MQLLSLSCNHCGAPLEAPESARFLTCSHCGSRLKVAHSGSASYTELVDQVGEIHTATREMAEDLEEIKLHKRLESLDREWSQRQANYLSHDKHGNVRTPSTGGALVGGGIMTAFGAFWTVMAFSITAGSPFGAAKVFPLFGLIFVIGGIVTMARGATRAQAYDRHLRDYQRRRDRLLDEMREGR